MYVSVCVCVCGEGEGEGEGERERERERERLTLRNWLMQPMKAASPKSTRWGSRLETRIGASVVVQVRRLSAGRIPSCSGGQSFFY